MVKEAQSGFAVVEQFDATLETYQGAVRNCELARRLHARLLKI